LLITFGSLIARTGFCGEAHYALANEWLSLLTERFQKQHPQCRCICVEWSIWSGAGMGQRLGRVDALLREGITPITVDQGVLLLRQLLCSPSLPTSIMVSGRFGDPPTLRFKNATLPSMRFLEVPRCYYPGVELVADAEVSRETDPYLDDHVLGKDRLMPAVLALEAMAQAAKGLSGDAPNSFESVELLQPIIIPDDGKTTIRVAALRREDGRVDVVLRSSVTEFQVDHARGICRSVIADVDFQWARATALKRLPEVQSLDLDPAQDLYGDLLFHKGRFRRLQGYRRLTARDCIAVIAPPRPGTWFADQLPSVLLLGDPSGRDAAIHALQACVPHRTVLPVSVERVCIFHGRNENGMVHAVERKDDADSYVFDLTLFNSAGEVTETWTGLRLKAIQSRQMDRPWPIGLAGPFLERQVAELLGCKEISIRLAKLSQCQDASIPGIQEELGSLTHRPDGRPELKGTYRHVSLAYGDGLVLGVSSDHTLGCDLEAVTVKGTHVWSDVLGPTGEALTRQIRKLTSDNIEVAAARV
jgi:enediyne polyketide synthase